MTHVQAGDINGDGVLEVVALAGKFAYVLENDGDLGLALRNGGCRGCALGDQPG